MATDLTAVLFAFSHEAQPFLRRRRLNPNGLFRQFGPGVVVLVMGDMGEDAASSAVDKVFEVYPKVKRVISAGFCGGLVEDAGIGDTVIGSDSLVTADRPVVTAEERRALHATTGARVVDMESAVIARRCSEAGVDFVSIRVVSDNLEHPLPADLLPAMNGERIRTIRLLMAIWRRPRLIVDLWRLAQHSRLAANRLADALVAYLG